MKYKLITKQLQTMKNESKKEKTKKLINNILKNGNKKLSFRKGKKEVVTIKQNTPNLVGESYNYTKTSFFRS